MYNSKYNYAETHYDMLGGPNPLSNYSFKYLMKNSVNCSLLINLDTLLIDYSFLTEMHNLFSDFYASYEHWHMSNISVLTPAGMENHLRGKHFLKKYSFFLSKLSRDSKYTLKNICSKMFLSFWQTAFYTSKRPSFNGETVKSHFFRSFSKETQTECS